MVLQFEGEKIFIGCQMTSAFSGFNQLILGETSFRYNKMELIILTRFIIVELLLGHKCCYPTFIESVKRIQRNNFHLFLTSLEIIVSIRDKLTATKTY